jgi:hypothetical protein
VTFPIQRTQSFTGMLEVETAGKSVIPAFGQITVTFEGEEVLSPIGKSGEFYLENLTSGRFQAKVELKRVCVGRQLLVQQRERGELRPVQCVHQQPHRLHRHHYPHLHGRGGPTDAITIDLSTGSATSYAPRQMRQGSDALNYNLFRDPSRLEIWGDGTGGSSRYGPMVPPNNMQVNLTIYGCIPVRQNVRVDTYSDTITVIINF